MKDVDWFVGGSLDSHFTQLVYAWICSLRQGRCPSLALLFGGGVGGEGGGESGTGGGQGGAGGLRGKVDGSSTSELSDAWVWKNRGGPQPCASIHEDREAGNTGSNTGSNYSIICE